MKRTFIILLIATFVLAACGRIAANEAPVEYPKSDVGMGGGDPGYGEESFAPSAPLPQGTMMPASERDTTGGKVDASGRERMVIRNADLSIVVKDPETAMTEITRLAEELGGFVVSSNLYQSYTSSGLPVPEASVTIRVPAEKLDDALERIKEQVNNIL